MDGERSIRKMITIPQNPVVSTQTVSVPTNPLPGCCSEFTLRALADTSGLALQNDVAGFIWWFEPIVSAASMVLKKWENGAWASKATLNTNTYGIYGAFGYFTNNENQKFISYKLEWSKVLSAFGTGNYKVTMSYTAPLFPNQEVDSYEYCLQTYSPFLADNTVRLEYWLSGVTGDIEDDTKIKDYGSLNWYNSLRLPGFFGYPKSTYKEEDIEYNSGQRVFVEDEQMPVYKLKLKLLPSFIHDILRTDFMMADTLAITDYNSKNAGVFIQKYVRKDSGYEPKWYELQSNFATVELQFKPQFNRFRKLR